MSKGARKSGHRSQIQNQSKHLIAANAVALDWIQVRETLFK